MSERQNWLTAAQAAQVLKVTQRQVNRYGALGRLSTKRVGRRVLYLASDVAQLADDLQVDTRPLPAPRSDGGALLPPELVRHLADEAESRRRMGERLDRIERQIGEPARLALPRWLLIIIALAIVALFATFILLVVLAARLS